MSAEAQRRYRELHPDRARESRRQWGQSEAGRQSALLSRQRYYASEKGQDARRRQHEVERVADSYLARKAVSRALDAGRLARQVCEICGATTAQAHHQNGYGRPHWLDVRWLCPLHHAKAHEGGES